MKTRKVISFLTALAVFAGTGLHICSRSVYVSADTVDSDIALSVFLRIFPIMSISPLIQMPYGNRMRLRLLLFLHYPHTRISAAY